jgi:Protein of unknown function (DUF3551)
MFYGEPVPASPENAQADGSKMMRTALFGLVASAAALVLVGTADAQAYPVYPWCAYLARGSTNCYFSTFSQCRQYVSGLGGSCSQNPFYGAYGYGAAPRGKRYRRY